MIKGNLIGNGVVRQGGVKHGIDRAGDGTGWRDGWGCGRLEGVEGPESVGGRGPGAGE
jgi:hypothetical protein